MGDIPVGRRRRVDASPEHLWALIDDPAQLSRWFGFAERIEIIEGSGLGRRQRLYGRWGRKPSEIDQVVTEYDPLRRFGWRHVEERLGGKPAPKFAADTHFVIELHPDGDGTVVELKSTQVPAGTLRGLVMHLFGKREVTQHMERSLDELARVAVSP
jgi:uncharacterized protein YndB with AHSA1/START domain